MKLTDTFVRKVKLKKGNKEDWYSDGRGTNFYLRVRDGEQKDWFFRGVLGNKTIKRGLGAYLHHYYFFMRITTSKYFAAY